MRFKQFISESRGQDITLAEAAAWIKKNSKIMMEELKLHDGANLLYRGKERHGAPQISDSRGKVRTSANTSNEYTLLVDSAAKWKKFPKRSESFICSTSSKYAKMYGKLQIVFPKDSTLFGCAGTGDFWNAFPSLNMIDVGDMNQLNKYINKMLNLAGLDSHQSDANILRERLRQVTMDIIATESDPNSYSAKLTISAMKKLKVDNIEALLDKILDPNENGPHTFNMHDWENFYTEANEYWFADEAVFVPVDMKAELLEMIE